jgi:uncharacterized protein YndB with AHSA1/START domain
MYDHVIWPEPFHPGVSAIYGLNDIDVGASADTVWRLLVDAESWHLYFTPENQVRVLGGERELALGTRLTRVTGGYPMSLVVTECIAGRRLAWATTVDGDDTGSTAYHGWVITPTAEGCHVLTEETQQGPFFVEMIGRRNPGLLYRYHQEWVETLARAAEQEHRARARRPSDPDAGHRP